MLRPGGHGGCGCLAEQRGERCRDGDGRVSQAQERGSGGVDGDVVQGELGDAEGRLGEQQDRPVHGVGMASRPLPRVHGMRKDLHGEGQAYGRSAERKRVPHPLGT